MENVTVPTAQDQREPDFTGTESPNLSTPDNVGELQGEESGEGRPELTSEVEVTPTVRIKGGEKTFRYVNHGGNFFTGIDTTSEEASQKRAARMKRFGHEMVSSEQEDPEHSVERRKARAKRFGVKLVATGGEPIKLINSLPVVPNAEIRPEAIHLHGTDEMSSRDVFSYFKLYSPRNIEWVNDSSCNVVWDDTASAHRALFGLGRQPVALHSQYENESSVKPMDTDQNQTDQNQIDQIQNKTDWNQSQTDQNQSAQIQSTKDESCSLVHRDQNEAKGEKSCDSFLHWRYGESHPKANRLLLRFATVADLKEKGAAKNSVYYQKYGKPKESWSLKERAMRGGGRGGGGKEQEDLRNHIGKKHFIRREEEDMEIEESPSDSNPFSSLSKRPKPLYSDRPDDSLDVTEMMDESEKQRRLSELAEASDRVGLGGGAGDLRQTIQHKKKRRNLKLRIGHYPRLVEEKR